MKIWNKLASDSEIEKASIALNKNGISVEVVDNGNIAKERVLNLIPKGKEVMTMSSVTLEITGIENAINESGNYDSVKEKLFGKNRKLDNLTMQKLGAAPEYALGSVHAVTQDGSLLIASNTGSQLPAYSYGASHVIWVVGTQKIVKDTKEGIQRIYDYVYPLEDAHMKRLYNTGSNVSKLLIINKELKKGRLHLIFVKEILGY